ncbi:DUF1826 domain-containing protein [Tenacibaculum agarivorans]|uniref:DUF1826 domain-containing protein n=1 Tax=Tenacibaculum agarivorans TaxID=1908389 RepID=UPI00094BC128|nr:DUF1826 domain-containing protein [Tenacibaculum agarivorans]
MKVAELVKNWEVGTTPIILNQIHDSYVNITIYNRDIHALEKEINSLKQKKIRCTSNGDINVILNELQEVVQLNQNSFLLKDIQNLLFSFQEITKKKNFNLFLATVTTNMCKRFHMDCNSLRMLCTYSGPGTLWLTEENINREALDSYENNEAIVIDLKHIQQTKTGAVIILKGNKYSEQGIQGVVHRSPTIEESGEKRLLLRIDIN